MLIWMQNNLNGIAVGILATCIVGIISFVGRKIFQIVKMIKSEYTGKWEQLIYANGDDHYTGSIVKHDVYKIQHTKILYTGKLVINIREIIRRVVPAEQQHRQWDCIGYSDGDVLTILYQSKEAQKSRGCIYLRLFKDFEFRGYYLEEHRDGTVDKTPVILRKVVE